MYHAILLLLSALISMLYSFSVYGAPVGLNHSFGEVASNIYEPVSIIIQLVRAVSFISGGGLILGGLIKYIDYRRNPIAVRLSTVTFMFIFGVSLILIGFIPFKANGFSY
jgi:hypothetical protein